MSTKDVVTGGSSSKNAPNAQRGLTVRARRRREEAVRRLVSDVQNHNEATGGDLDWLLASTLATALEKNLDKDLHACFLAEAKDNAAKIGQVCHDHADAFLVSVAQVAALSTPSADLADGLKEAENELFHNTIAPMMDIVTQYEHAVAALARIQTLGYLLQACQKIAVQIERARKNYGRPKTALDAVQKARTALAAPVLVQPTTIPQPTISLANTPFGQRALTYIPKIEAEVWNHAKRNLQKWFKAPDSIKAGRAALRETAFSVGCGGPGELGLGGILPASFLWRAQHADNWISRIHDQHRIARAARAAYFLDRDGIKDADFLKTTSPGIERYGEAVAVAFGWYRCWTDGSNLLVDPAEFLSNNDANALDSSTSSRHGIASSTTSNAAAAAAAAAAISSRHGRGKSLGFRASTSSRSRDFQEISSTLGGGIANKFSSASSQFSSHWTELLVPNMLLPNAPTKSEDDAQLRIMPESVHPVRRAEVAFRLLQKTEEFVAYYETNRFGEMKIGGDGKDSIRSALSFLVNDDVSLGSDRTFFAKMVPNLCAAIIGFCAEESALELSNFGDDDDKDDQDLDEDKHGKGKNRINKKDDDNDHDEERTATKEGDKPSKSSSQQQQSLLGASTGLQPSRFRDASERYERQLIAELGDLVRARIDRANLGELTRVSRLLLAFRTALKIVHPSSTARRLDKDLINMDSDTLKTVIKVAQDEQLKATFAIVNDDQKVPMLVSDAPNSTGLSGKYNTPKTSGMPDPEEVGLPFGLAQMKQVPQKAETDFQDRSRTSYNQAPLDEAFTFSHSVPVVLRSLHARAITCAVFALCQLEMGQKFPEAKGSAAAAFVLNCVEECISAAVVGMKSDNAVGEGSVERAVQVMANISALQQALPRFFGTLLRGMFHVGLVRGAEVDETFTYAEKVLKASDKACDAQVGSTYSLVYEICRNKIDSHINISLENFQWVAKSFRETPNPYCEGLVGFLKSVFSALGPMDEGSRAGLHFSCCGHVSERLVKILSGKTGDTSMLDDGTLPPIARIDAFGLRNLLTDCEEFERFADSTGIPSLRDCFSELRILTSVMLDKELPTLLLPENAASRRRKYPILSLDKVVSVIV
jgi:hypothetical protein